MSTLKTYARGDLDTGSRTTWPVVPALKEETRVVPGTWVTHPVLGGFGTVVAVTDDQVTVLWVESPRSSYFKPPNVKRVTTQSIANSLIEVQPMSMPSGLVFYLDYAYGSGSLGPGDPTDK